MIDEPRSLVLAEIQAEPFLIEVPAPWACVTTGLFVDMTAVECLSEDFSLNRKEKSSNVQRKAAVAVPRLKYFIRSLKYCYKYIESSLQMLHHISYIESYSF